jgi:glutathione S-transferase
VDRWLHWQSCHLMMAVAALQAGTTQDVSTVTPLLRILDARLAGRDYVLGDLTVADFAICPYLITKIGRKLDYSSCPNVTAWLDRMEKLKGFVATQVRMPPPAA